MSQSYYQACSSVKKLDIFTTEVERQPLNLKTPTPPELEKLKWIIITSDNADEVMAKLEEQFIDYVFVLVSLIKIFN